MNYAHYRDHIAKRRPKKKTVKTSTPLQNVSIKMPKTETERDVQYPLLQLTEFSRNVRTTQTAI